MFKTSITKSSRPHPTMAHHFQTAATLTSTKKSFTIQEAGNQPPRQDNQTILYAHPLCPYVERAWLALLEKDVDFCLVHVDLSNKPSWYRKINPRGLVPAVSHAGAVHVESLDICRWADTEFSSGPPLAPQDAADKTRMQQVLNAGSSLVDAGMGFVAGRTGRFWGIGSGQTPSQKKSFEAALSAAIVEPVKASGGPFLLGADVTLADIAIYPFVSRFDVAAREFAGFYVREAVGGAVGTWLRAMEERPACKITTADRDLLLKAYQKHRCLDFFDYDSYAACALHPFNEQYLVL